MPQTGEARAWWADVEHVRETIERRRAAERQADAARAERHLSIVADHRSGGNHDRDRRSADLCAHDRRAGDRRAGGHRPGQPRAAESGGAQSRTAESRTAELRAVERRTGERRRGHHAAPRRTVEITGRTVPAPAVPRAGGDPTVAFGARGSSRRPSLSPADRLVYRPDRIAMWAVVLGFVLILVAATSS